MQPLSDSMEKINRPKKTESNSWVWAVTVFWYSKERGDFWLLRAWLGERPKMCYVTKILLNIKSMLWKIQACLVLGSLARDSHPDVAWRRSVREHCWDAAWGSEEGLAWGADHRGCSQGLAPLQLKALPHGSSPRRGFGPVASLYGQSWASITTKRLNPWFITCLWGIIMNFTKWKGAFLVLCIPLSNLKWGGGVWGVEDE